MDAGQGTRAADADRERVAQRLRLAVDDGRLSLTEYDDRLRAAYAATTYADLHRVTSDLPELPDAQLPTDREARATTRLRQDLAEWAAEWRSWLDGAIIMITVWGLMSMAAGEVKGFWPTIPLRIWAAVLIAAAVHGCGLRPEPPRNVQRHRTKGSSARREDS